MLFGAILAVAAPLAGCHDDSVRADVDGTALDAEEEIAESAADSASPVDAEVLCHGPSITVLDATVPDTDAESYCRFDLPCGIQDPHLAIVGCELRQRDPDSGAIGDAPAFACRVPDDAGCVDGAMTGATDAAIVLVCECDIFTGGGRSGRRRTVTRGRSMLGAYLARLAREERASVSAFESLHGDLAAHGAPRKLVEGARKSALDERRHARMVGALAKRCGGAVDRQHERFRRKSRTLSSIASDNAVEGCVRETYAALLASFQAVHARDATLRRMLATIARDETRHAALSWAIARWSEGQLSPSARARVDSARRRALAELDEELLREPDRVLVAVAGVPTPPIARELLRRMAEGLGLRSV